MPRIPELDALRGVAAVVIMVIHLRFMGRYPWWGTGFDVDLFFVLSGYLITASILGGVRARNVLSVFYTRRALRIWPLYYLVLILCALVNPLLPRPRPHEGVLQVLTFTQNVQGYWSGHVPTYSRFFRHTWTLAIEEQFYLLWPLLVLWLGRRRIGLPIAALVVVPVVLRAQGLPKNLLLTRCDGLALGALLAVILEDREWVGRHSRGLRMTFGMVALAAFGFPAWGRPLLASAQATWPAAGWDPTITSIEMFRTALADFGLIGLVICSSGRPWLAWLRDRRLCAAGRISFGLYMYHPIVFGVVGLIHGRLGLKPSLAMDVLKAVACFGVARLSWRYFEQPILALKDRLSYRVESAPPLRIEPGHPDLLRGTRAELAEPVVTATSHDDTSR